MYIFESIYFSEGKGDIIIATKSGGIGSCSVQFKIFKAHPVCILKPLLRVKGMIYVIRNSVQYSFLVLLIFCFEVIVNGFISGIANFLKHRMTKQRRLHPGFQIL